MAPARSFTPVWFPNTVQWISTMPQVRAEAGTEGGGSQGGEGQQNPDPQQAQNPPAGTPPANPTSPEERRFTQAELEQILKQRLERAQARAAEEAETKRLEEQKEFAKLATQREAQIKKLEPQVEELSQANTRLVEHIEKQIKSGMSGWPDELKALVPKEGDIFSRLASFEAAAKVYTQFGPGAQSNEGGSGRTPGSPRAPRPAGPNDNPVDRERERLARTGKYRSI